MTLALCLFYVVFCSVNVTVVRIDQGWRRRAGFFIVYLSFRNFCWGWSLFSLMPVICSVISVWYTLGFLKELKYQGIDFSNYFIHFFFIIFMSLKISTTLIYKQTSIKAQHIYILNTNGPSTIQNIHKYQTFTIFENSVSL